MNNYKNNDVYEYLIGNSKKVIIWGAGVFGRLIYYKCKKANIKIVAFCDENREIQNSYVDGDICIYGFEKIREMWPSDLFFIITPKEIEEIIRIIETNPKYCWGSVDLFYSIGDLFQLFTYKQLVNSGLFFLIERWFQHYAFSHSETDNIFFPSVDLVITERCSLRCQSCSNLMQYYQKPVDFNINSIKDEVRELSKISDEIFELRILGGEPFMNSDLFEIVEYASQFENIRSICIYTNATLMFSEKEFERLRNINRIWFSISDYGELSINLDKLRNELDRLGIFYHVTDFMWTECSTIKKNNRSSEELTNLFGNCCVNTTVTLLKGNLYPCPFIANGINLSALPKEHGNYINIFERCDLKEIRAKIRKTLINRKFFSLCDYCNGRPMFPTEEELIAPHIQINQPRKYYKYEE